VPKDESLARFRRVVAHALAQLESRRGEVNDLNVFPVADGDTGDNMAMTLHAVLDELDRLNGEPIDEIGREQVVAAVARAALLGARGNSGVILSQIVRGAAEELASRPGELVDPVLVAAAFAEAADAAYDSVRDPAEGTILSAMRAIAHRLAHELAHMEKPRLEPGASPAEQDELLAEVLERALEAAKEAVQRGPEQLEVLREAGVVDAGAYGLTVIIAGVIAALRNDEGPEVEHELPPSRALHASEHDESEFRYCTNFAVTGEDLDGPSFVRPLEALGDSVMVVGDEPTLRVHVHTDEPQRVKDLFAAHGTISREEIADMIEQTAAREARLEGGNGNGAAPADALCAVVAVAGGDGVLGLFEELGATLVDGGPTLNPSTAELSEAIAHAPGREVVLLPNSKDVKMAADSAAKLSDKQVEVVATTAPQQGLVALLAFDPARSSSVNARALERVIGEVRCGGVAPAARDDKQGRFAAGAALAYEGDELLASGEPRDALAAAIERLAAGAEVLTCIAGSDAPLERGAVEGLVPDGVELDYHDGGQPAWWWLLCAE